MKNQTPTPRPRSHKESVEATISLVRDAIDALHEAKSAWGSMSDHQRIIASRMLSREETMFVENITQEGENHD